jgi:uncharacterized protein (TIGR02599 family)
MNMQHRSHGFTLVEVMVAAGIVVVIMVVLLGMTDQTQRLVKATSSKVEQFQQARAGFEAMTRRLSQATLNSFWDYVYAPNTGTPIGYARKAELRFRSGPMSGNSGITGSTAKYWPSHGVFFQAPLGTVQDTVNLSAMDHLLNTWGYFVEIGSDINSFPAFLNNIVTPRTRYRLMEYMEPSEQLSVYRNQGNDPNNQKWFSQSLAPTNATRPVHVLAENIVALIILPRLSLADERRINPNPATPPLLAPNYNYDSTQTGAYNASIASNTTTNNPLLNSQNQLPPVVQVIMVAIDEPSARRLQDLYGSDPYLGIRTNPEPIMGRNLFTDPTMLNDTTTNPLGDLTVLQNLLSSSSNPNIRASYRVFSTNVTIKGAKWSLQ